MMQRILRGKLLYLTLGVIVLGLYWRSAVWDSSRPPGHGVTQPAVPLEILPGPRTAGERPLALREPGVIEFPVEPPPMQAPTAGGWSGEFDVRHALEVSRREPVVGLLLSGLTVFGAGMTIAGLLYGLWGCLTGRIRSIWVMPWHQLPAWSFGELVRVTLLGLFMGSLLPLVRRGAMARRPAWGDDVHLWMTGSMLVLDIFVILLIAAFARGKAGSLGQSMGFVAPQGWRTVATGFRGYLAVFPWLFLLLYLSLRVAHLLGVEPPIEPIQQLIMEEDRGWVLALTMLLACGLGPVAEELVFRGILYAAIRRGTSWITAMLASAAVFAFVHTNPVSFFPIMALGCLLAYLYERTGSLIAPFSVHLVHNTFLLASALVARYVMVSM